MTDEDLGGQVLANQIGIALPDIPLFYTQLPHGKKDPGSCTTFEIWEAINSKKGVVVGWLEQGQLQARRSAQ